VPSCARENAYVIGQQSNGAATASLPRRLVCLDGRASGAELLRLAPGVLEIGAGVGVDELADLDPLEAVML
jgi:hypothetical protein